MAFNWQDTFQRQPRSSATLCISLHNYLEFYKALEHVPFTVSKTELIATTRNFILELPNDGKPQKFKKYQQNLRNKYLGLTLKKYPKTKMKVFRPCLNLLELLTFFTIFSKNCLQKETLTYLSSQSPLKVNILTFFVTSKSSQQKQSN